MSKPETLSEFYRDKLDIEPIFNESGIGHCNIFRLEDCMTGSKYARRDFYKIMLMRGHNLYHYADKSIEIDGSTLMFFSPNVPYTWEYLSEDVNGYFCIFTESFFTEKMRGSLNELPMFAHGGKPTYFLTPEQDQEVAAVFLKMFSEIDSDYIYKYDLLRNYILELTHYAMKRQPSEAIYQHPDANSRITSVFNELLERQFPIETTSQRFSLRSAKDFAQQLSVHVNHLNRAIKQTTGKTTTHLIADRLLAESKALLRHTDWNIAEISYCLGFEQAAHFNNFFKKLTTVTPSYFRNV